MTDGRRDAMHFSVRFKILIVLLAISMASLVVTGYLAFAAISNMGNFAETSSSALGDQALNDSTSALEGAARQYLLQMATDQASITTLLLSDVENEIRSAGVRAEEIQEKPTTGAAEAGSLSFPASPLNNRLNGFWVFLAPGATTNMGSPEYTAVSALDDTLKTIYDVDPDLSAIYVATDSGIFRSYHPGGPAPVSSYDPRTRIWYTAARASGNVTWTGPYVDATEEGLVVTCSVPVYSKEYGYWVIGADVSIDTINQDILNWTFGKGGYAILLDSQGNIISMPDLSAGNLSWQQEYHKENVLTDPDPQIRAIARNMTSGRTGVESASFNGTPKFIAYAPVPFLNWSVGIAMPVREIVAPVEETRSKIKNATSVTKEGIGIQTSFLLEIFIVLMAGMIVVVIVLSYSLAKHVTRPLDTLIQGTAALGDGDLDYRVPVLTRDEFGDLAASFNRMATDLKQNIEDLKQTTAEKERYTREIEIAKSIQESFLPEEIPKIPGIDMAAFALPAQEVGGDFYDFIRVGPDRWGLVMADVSGKGISAALFMALSRTLVKVSVSQDPDIRSSILRANRLIFAESRSCMFVTLFYAVLDARARTLSFVDAGHTASVHITGGENPVVTLLRGKGMALGVEEEMALEEKMLPLGSGDLIVMYTDGVTEAENSGHDIFGEERLAAFSLANRHLPAQDFADALLREIRAFAGSAPQADDITLLVVRVR
ncbi:MAG: SpoIIE family protein phosphatase [Methanoregulaceae archaeon]